MTTTGSAVVRRALSDTRIDGIFGPVTETATGQSQRDGGWVADDIVGPAAWAVLAGGGARPPMLMQRSHGSAAAGRCPPACAVPAWAAGREFSAPSWQLGA
jgi:hypothetical protein